MDIVQGKEFSYHVGSLVAKTGSFQFYLCEQVETGRSCFLQVALEVEKNGVLDRASYLLRELLDRSDKLEEEYAKVKEDPKDLLNYQLGFPELVETFLSSKGFRVNILAIREVEQPQNMVPLARMVHKDRLRVDLRTSVWIMGKLLKILTFAHDQGIAIGQVSAGNIMIEPDQHYVVVFDWSAAQILTDEVPRATQQAEISQAAQAVILALGGKVGARFIPDDGEEGYDPYTNHLWRLAEGVESNAGKAHERFYGLVDGLWKREFYPFTCHSI